MLYDCMLTNFPPLEQLESHESLSEPVDLDISFPGLEDFQDILADVDGIIPEPNFLDNLLQTWAPSESFAKVDDLLSELRNFQLPEPVPVQPQPEAPPPVEPPKFSPIKLTFRRTSKGFSCKLGSKETSVKTKKTEKSEKSQPTKSSAKKGSGKGKCKMPESKKVAPVKKIKSQKVTESQKPSELQKLLEPQKCSEPQKRSEPQKKSGKSSGSAVMKAKTFPPVLSEKKKIAPQVAAKPMKKEAETKEISERIKIKLQDTKKRSITVIPALPEDPTKKKRGRKPKVDTEKLRMLEAIQIDHDYCLSPMAASKIPKVTKNLPVKSSRSLLKPRPTEVPTKKIAIEKSVPSPIQKTEISPSKPVDKISPIQKTEVPPTKLSTPVEKVEAPVQKTEVHKIQPVQEKLSVPVEKTEKVETVEEKVAPKIETPKVEALENIVPDQKTDSIVPQINEEVKAPAVSKQKSISLQSYFKRKAVDPSKTKYEMYDLYYLSTNTGNPGHCEVGFHSIAYPTETIKKIRSVKEKKDSGCQTDITLESYLGKPLTVDESSEPVNEEFLPTEEIIPVIKIDEDCTPDFIPVIEIEEDECEPVPSSNNNKQISNQNLALEPVSVHSVRDDGCSSRGSSVKRKRRDSSRSSSRSSRSSSSSSDSDDSRRYRRKYRRSRSPSPNRRRHGLGDVSRDYYSRSCDSRSSNYSSGSSSRHSTPNYRASVYSSNGSRSSSNSSYYSNNSKRSYSSRRNYRESSYSSRSQHSDSRYRESRRSDYEWKRRKEEEEERTATEERRVVYVGNLTDKTTRDDLYDNFRSFGSIECIRLRFKPDGHNYGFVTFRNRKDAFDAIEESKKDKSFPYKEVSFGGRRAFCQREYSDLDGRKAHAEERSNGRSNDNDDDFGTLLKKYADSQKRQRS